MPRGGNRFGGRGKQGPDFSWDDEEPTAVTNSNKPAPTFPEVHFPIPKPLDHSEVAAVNRFLSFRSRTRGGSFFATLDPSTLTDDKGKVTPRAGFDPFNDQEAFASRFRKKKRTLPDVTSQDFALEFFPKELWPTLDPKRRHALWKEVDPAQFGETRPRKRKRRLSTQAVGRDGDDEQEDSGEDSDAIVTRRRKHDAERSRKAERESRQRRGLDAEDDYPEGDRDADEDGEGEDEPQDSEFDESEDEDNDYNAEQYFDDGDDGGNDDEGGGDDFY